MKYSCQFEFTTCNPKTSKFTGKSGEMEFEGEFNFDFEKLTEEHIADLKNDELLLGYIAQDLEKSHKQKNIFELTITSIKQI